MDTLTARSASAGVVSPSLSSSLPASVISGSTTSASPAAAAVITALRTD